MDIELTPGIGADARILSGKPTVRGTETAFSALVAAVAQRDSLMAVAEEFGVSVEDVRAALRYAADLADRPVSTEHPLRAVAGMFEGDSTHWAADHDEAFATGSTEPIA